MTISIFCPEKHLVLAAQRCPHCGWVRPKSTKIGAPLWPPQSLGGELGGPGRNVFAQPAAIKDIAVFPLIQGELVAVDLSSGQVKWRRALGEGMHTHALIPDGDQRFLLALRDERSIELAGNGGLFSLYPETGALQCLWQADGHQLTDPVLTEHLILVRVSSGGLVALWRKPEPTVKWQVPLNSYWATRPLVSEGKVVVSDGRAMQGESYLLGLDLENGKQIWSKSTREMLSHTPLAVNGQLVFRQGQDQLVAADIKAGSISWQKPYKRVYGTPAVRDNLVYVVRRGQAPAAQPGHYTLDALESSSGKLVWETPLPAKARTRIGPVLAGDWLIMGCDEGQILALDPENGQKVWEYALGSEEQPLRCELVEVNGLLLAGTYDGLVAALQLQPAGDKLPDPDELMREGKSILAADVLALKGDFRRSAELYADKLGGIEQAILLYQQGNHFNEIGELELAQGHLAQARSAFNKAGNQRREPYVLALMGDHYSAAHLYLEISDLRKAAEEFEKADDINKAMEQYKKLGDQANYARLKNKLPAGDSKIDWLISEGNFVEAGDVAVDLGLYQKAVSCYQTAGLREKEFAALGLLLNILQEVWVYARRAELARCLGKFKEEAEALEKLEDNAERTAEAYERAAKQILARGSQPGDMKSAADLFELAARFFDMAYLENEAKICKDQVHRCRQAPLISVEAKVKKAYRVGVLNALELTICNVGYGPAHNVKINIPQEYFTVRAQREKDHLDYDRLAKGMERTGKFYLTPLQEGGEVPMDIDWTWEDKNGTKGSGCTHEEVIVKAKGESDSGDEKGPKNGDNIYIYNPQNIVMGGIQATNANIGNSGTINQAGEDVVQGEKYTDNAQKGDRAAVNRTVSQDPNPPAAQEITKIACPVCSMLIPVDSNFCQSCQNPINSAAGAGG